MQLSKEQILVIMQGMVENLYDIARYLYERGSLERATEAQKIAAEGYRTLLLGKS